MKVGSEPNYVPPTTINEEEQAALGMYIVSVIVNSITSLGVITYIVICVLANPLP